MHFKSFAVSLILIAGLLFLSSWDSGSSSVSDEYNPNLSGQQQKNIALSQVASDEFNDALYSMLISEGLSPAAARAVTDCVQPEAVKLINQTPASQFNVSESEALRLGEQIGLEAANNCMARIT